VAGPDLLSLTDISPSGQTWYDAALPVARKTRWISHVFWPVKRGGVPRLMTSRTKATGAFFGSIVAFLLCLATAGAAWADSTDSHAGNSESGWARVSFGLKGGLSLSQHSGIEERGSEYSVSSHWRSGFAAGGFVYVPITSRFGIQQEVFYTQKGSSQEISVDILEIPTVLHVTYDMDYVEIPVFFRFDWYEWDRSAFYSLAGTALSFKVHDRYVLDGEIDDGTQTVPLHADSDMSEVEMFDYSFVYGMGVDFSLFGARVLVEYRFAIGWNSLAMPTYAYVPFEDGQILIENEPVPLKNQNHLLLFGVTF
jgi:hypothetical protein